VKQKVFGSPEEAMKALAETVQVGDREGVWLFWDPRAKTSLILEIRFRIRIHKIGL